MRPQLKLALPALALLLSWPRAAEAALPPPEIGVPTVYAEGGAQPLPVAYVSGDVTLTCRERSASSLECDLRAVHRLRSTASEPLEVKLDPTEPVCTSARHTFDGRPSSPSRPYGGPHALVLEPGRTHVFETRGQVRLGVPPSWILFHALEVRHLLLGEVPATNAAFSLRLAPPGPNFAETGRARVRVTLPEGWSFAGSGGRAFAADLAEHDALRIEHDAPLAFFHGGPLVGLGGELDEGFRARLGYEIGFHELGIAGLDADFDFDGVAVVSPRVEFALPQIAILPSLGAGLGVPVRIADETQVGGRLQLTATIFASFVTSLDYYPKDDFWEATMLGVVGL